MNNEPLLIIIMWQIIIIIVVVVVIVIIMCNNLVECLICWQFAIFHRGNEPACAMMIDTLFVSMVWIRNAMLLNACTLLFTITYHACLFVQLENLMYYTENNHNKVVLRDFYLSTFENGPITEPCGTPEYLGRTSYLMSVCVSVGVNIDTLSRHSHPRLPISLQLWS